MVKAHRIEDFGGRDLILAFIEGVRWVGNICFHNKDRALVSSGLQTTGDGNRHSIVKAFTGSLGGSLYPEDTILTRFVHISHVKQGTCTYQR